MGQCKNIKEKRDYIIAIGEIGQEINLMNSSLDIINMEV